MGRNSVNSFYLERLGRRVSEFLEDGLIKTYPWIKNQVETLGKDIALKANSLY
tara:strand:- start:420 stop:578 length:159 start_codon:yes stop_codon:yes gene_type:complete